MKSLSQFEQIDLESASKTQMADMVRALLKRANKDAQEIQRKRAKSRLYSELAGHRETEWIKP